MHFSKNSQGLRMPRTDTRPDQLGIRWNGRVLNGEQSVQKALYLAESGTTPSIKAISAGRSPEKAYPEGQDPVLRAHMEKGGHS